MPSNGTKLEKIDYQSDIENGVCHLGLTTTWACRASGVNVLKAFLNRC
jgi:hypothetical protein